MVGADLVVVEREGELQLLVVGGLTGGEVPIVVGDDPVVRVVLEARFDACGDQAMTAACRADAGYMVFAIPMIVFMFATCFPFQVSPPPI